MTDAEDRSPSALTDPATILRESPEVALLRGVDAEAAVRENEQVARDATARTGADVGMLSKLQEDGVVSAFLKLSDQFLGQLGFTEHGFRHANLVGRIAHNVLHHLGADDDVCEPEDQPAAFSARAPSDEDHDRHQQHQHARKRDRGEGHEHVGDSLESGVGEQRHGLQGVIDLQRNVGQRLFPGNARIGARPGPRFRNSYGPGRLG